MRPHLAVSHTTDEGKSVYRPQTRGLLLQKPRPPLMKTQFNALMGRLEARRGDNERCAVRDGVSTALAPLRFAGNEKTSSARESLCGSLDDSRGGNRIITPEVADATPPIQASAACCSIRDLTSGYLAEGSGDNHQQCVKIQHGTAH